MNKQNVYFRPKAISWLIVVGFIVYTPSIYANNQDSVEQDAQELSTIHVTGKRQANRKDNEVTGLGKVVKTADQINREQILDIRGLTRYDPGISVVEQGRGATIGYAMRGVDKNRVAILVDGIPQVQSYSTLFSRANSGAINEIEYENIRSIELSKGSSSAEYGNGALGGAVGFRTKESGDIIKSGQNWGIDSKTAYSSKNRQLTQSIALAGKAGGWDGLAIFTHRKGQETQPHKATGEYLHTFDRLYGFADEYDLRPWSSANQKNSAWFVLKEECPTLLNCTPKAKAFPTRPVNELPTVRANPPLTDEEKAQLSAMVHPHESMSAKEYTGQNRILPNPMDYRSHSWLLKGGYRFSLEHYLGVVHEQTVQRYDIRDMTLPSYYEAGERPSHTDLGSLAQGIYSGSNILNGLVFDKGEHAQIGMNWSRTRFFDERHRKNRYGLHYRYDSVDKQGWADKWDIRFDRQNIRVDSRMSELYCSVYPTVDKNCRVSADKPWSYANSERNRYSEKRDMLQLGWEKIFDWYGVRHKVNVIGGWEKQRSLLQRSDYWETFAKGGWDKVAHPNANGSYDNPYIYTAKPVEIKHKDKCDYSGEARDLTDCTPRMIEGHNYFLSLRQTLNFGKYADLGIGVRYDRHRFSSNDSWTSVGTFRNWSWNGGLTVKPNEYLALSYRVSNGFRVPAAYEMFGYRVQGTRDKKFHHVADFRPEKSFNQEFGVGVKGMFGQLEASYFYNRYKDMIALAKRDGYQNDQHGYHNIQNVTLHGVNVLGKIYWDGVWSYLPEGLYSTVAYNQVKVKRRELHPGFTHTTDPILEAVQPGRYVLSLGYDHPSGKWGVNATTTYSKAKSGDELSGQRYSGGTSYTLRQMRSGRWYTHDLSAYWQWHKYLTLRGAIYNVTNRKYSTWESVRQSAISTINQPNVFNQQSGSAARYAAPGRNFVLSLEMKF